MTQFRTNPIFLAVLTSQLIFSVGFSQAQTAVGSKHKAAASNAGFVFDGAQVANAQDRSQYIHVWDKVSASELKRRFPGYTVKQMGEDCGGECFFVSSKTAFFRVDFRIGGRFSFYLIYSRAKSSHDSLGTAVGTPLAQAIGADTATCEEGDDTTCESKKIKGLSYIAGGCPVQRRTGDDYTIPACAIVDGFEISSTKGSSGR